MQQQIKSIKEELGGEGNEREVAEMKKKAETKKWSDAAKELFKSSIAKLERMHPQHAGLFCCVQSSWICCSICRGMNTQKTIMI